MATNDVMLFQGGQVPAHLQQAFTETNIEDKATVPSLMITGKIWTISYEGTKTPLQRNLDGDIVPVGVMRAVILDYAKRRGRAYYEGSYDPDATAAPVCWSEDGIAPDRNSPKLQSDKCANCPRAVKGSKVTDGGKQTVECGQHRMVAVMPVVGTKFFPHALRLKIAITSDWDKEATGEAEQGWRAFQQYTDFLKANQVTHTAMLVTKMKFDPNAAYPKIFFGADRWLTAEEIAQVKPFTVAEDTLKLLGSSWTPAGADGVRTDETTVDTPAPATKAQAATAAATVAAPAAAAPVAAPQPVDDEDAGEIIMAGLEAAPATPHQEPAQATQPQPAPAKAEPQPAAQKAAAAAPVVSADIPDDVKALLAEWEPAPE
jgi:hypothetical protein